MKRSGLKPASTGVRPDATDLERGREHYRRRAWAAAHAALLRADEAGALAGEDLERLALSAYLIGRDDDYLEFQRRAYRAYVAQGAGRRAARAAFWLGLRLMFRGEMGHANGWLGRARRLLDRGRRDCVERGYLMIAVAESEVEAGALEDAAATASDAARVGERFAEPDLIATAHHLLGRIRLRRGEVREGLALLDEAMIAVTGGELSPLVTGLIYCSVIDACQEACALERAREWTGALADWCDEQPEMVAFTGVCAVHRAEVLLARGDWSRALDEAERAAVRCSRSNSTAVGAALYQQAEVRRLRGELAAAEEGYRAASQQGFEPQPGLSLLRLSQARTSAAATALRRALDTTSDPVKRVRLLPAVVEVMLAAGRVEEARGASRELDGHAEHFASSALRALAGLSRGAVDLAEGNPTAALEGLRRAWKLSQAVDLPYLAARTRVLVGRCCEALDDAEGAKLELAAARTALERLGARADLATLDARPQRRATADQRALTSRELEVLRLVAGGKTNKAIAATLSLSEKTIERHLSNICTKLGVPSRTAATSYAYEHRLF
jgi:ATP/maltotriose-dependent transcriptional regulator MalT